MAINPCLLWFICYILNCYVIAAESVSTLLYYLLLVVESMVFLNYAVTMQEVIDKAQR